MLDKKKVLEIASAIDTAEYLGMNVRRKASRYYIPCPGHFERLGKEDGNLGNCVLQDKGYYCYACGKYVDVFDMVKEYTGCNFNEALEIVTQASGYNTKELSCTKKDIESRPPLSERELNAIGLSSKSCYNYINIANEENEINEIACKKVENENIIYESNSLSLLNLFKCDKRAYSNLVKAKAEEYKKKYKEMLSSCTSRNGAHADYIYKLLEKNNYLDEEDLFSLRNSIQDRYYIAQAILEKDF